MKRKPRKKRPKHIKIDGYDSIWEFILHDTLLKEWEHHSEKVEYTVKHILWPTFPYDRQLLYLFRLDEALVL